MRRVFGLFEVLFDALYLVSAGVLGLVLLLRRENNAQVLAGVMALVLASGDAFHLLPRIFVVLTGKDEALRAALGWGKQITSITMTFFYLLLWTIGQVVFGLEARGPWTYLVYLLIAVRIVLCLLPQNDWRGRHPPVLWAIWRNVPFFLLGAIVSVSFLVNRTASPALGWMWFAIALSFACYLPVVLWSNRNPKVGMLMFPKTCAYLWMLIMCLAI